MKFIVNKIFTFSLKKTLFIILFIFYNLFFFFNFSLNLSNSFNGNQTNISNKNKIQTINTFQNITKKDKKKTIIKGFEKINFSKNYYDRNRTKIIDDFFKNKYSKPKERKRFNKEHLTDQEIIKMFYILSPSLNIEYEIFNKSMQNFFDGKENNITLKDKFDSFKKNSKKNQDNRFQVGIYYGK